MDQKKLSEILIKNEVNGIIVSLKKDGSIDFAKNCDPYALMLINSFVSYNTNKMIDETVNAKNKMPEKKF